MIWSWICRRDRRCAGGFYPYCAIDPEYPDGFGRAGRKCCVPDITSPMASRIWRFHGRRRTTWSSSCGWPSTRITPTLRWTEYSALTTAPAPLHPRRTANGLTEPLVELARSSFARGQPCGCASLRLGLRQHRLQLRVAVATPRYLRAPESQRRIGDCDPPVFYAALCCLWGFRPVCTTALPGTKNDHVWAEAYIPQYGWLPGCDL